MKITPIPSAMPVPTADASGTLQPSRVESMRSIRMNTRATPLSNQMPAQLPNSINNSQTEPAAEATQPLSPQLALIAKQRRAFLREKEAFNRERAQYAKPTEGQYIESSRLKSDPLSVLMEQGVTYDQLTEAILKGQGNQEINALKAELNAMKQSIDQKFVENETSQRKQVVAEMHRDADSLVRSDDNYELVRAHGATPKAIELIERTYDQTGEIIDVPEALRLIEDELFKDAQKIARLKKMQNQMNPMVQQMQAQRREVGMTTLTNRDTATPPISAKQRAMAAFYGTLRR